MARGQECAQALLASTNLQTEVAPTLQTAVGKLREQEYAAVVIDQFEEPKEEGALTRIFASILVDHASQKPIVVGKGGEMIKRIGTEARQDLERLLGGRVYLDLHVKVREDWRDDERLLDELGLQQRR